MPNPTVEEMVNLRARKDSYAEANIKLLNDSLASQAEITRLNNDLARLSAELEAANATMQIVLNDNNTRYRSAGDEVERLRGLLKKHGIDPDEV